VNALSKLFIYIRHQQTAQILFGSLDTISTQILMKYVAVM